MFTTILLPIKDLLITLSFSYLYYYQARNLKRKDNKKHKGGKGRQQLLNNEDKADRLSVDTDEVN